MKGSIESRETNCLKANAIILCAVSASIYYYHPSSILPLSTCRPRTIVPDRRRCTGPRVSHTVTFQPTFPAARVSWKSSIRPFWWYSETAST